MATRASLQTGQLGAGGQNRTNDAASLAGSSTSSSVPDLTAFSALARKSLTDALDRIAGAKTLVLDAALAGPLGLVAEMTLLRDHGVDRLFWLEAGALTQAQKHIVYVCRSQIGLMRIIADQIKAAPAALNHTYTVLLAPRVTSICASTLEDLGVLGSVDIHEFPMALIPLERDVLSMELGAQAYKDIFLDSNYDAIYEMARSLHTMQRAFGLIPRLIGKGDAARRLVDIMSKLRKETPIATSSFGSAASTNYGQIDSMILLDRQVDMVTPLCTQLTYEGLIDEIIGIKNSFVEVDPALTNPAPPTPSSSSTPHFGAVGGPPRKKKHLLSTLGTAAASSASSGPTANGQAPAANAGDPLFGDLRDKNFTVVGGILNKVAKRINQDYEARHAAQTVGQIRDFVGRLSGLQAEHQALRLHTGLTEQIMATTTTDEFNRVLEIQQNLVAGLDLALQENAIRTLIDQAANPAAILRLLCLYSLITGGIKQKPLEEIKREFLQTFGFEYLPTLIHLSELGLLARPTTSKSAFTICRRPLKLVVDDVDESAPEDISYVYSGYAPISVRLVQHALGLGASSGGLVGGIAGAGARERSGATLNGWKGLDDVLQVLPGNIFEQVQKADDGTQTRRVHSQDQLPVTVVCFLGGCTYTEIAALRFTSQRMSGRKLLIVTTGIINGNNVMELLSPSEFARKR